MRSYNIWQNIIAQKVDNIFIQQNAICEVCLNSSISITSPVWKRSPWIKINNISLPPDRFYRSIKDTWRGKKLERLFELAYFLFREVFIVSLYEYIVSVKAEARKRTKIKTNYIKRDIEKDLILDGSPFAHVTRERIHILRFSSNVRGGRVK